MSAAQATGRPVRALPQRHRHPWIWLVGILVVALVATATWVGGSLTHAVNSSTKGGTASDIMVPAPLLGESTGRVNILLAGNSYDDGAHEGAALTDSIMVASLDLQTHSVTLVSIPRDLYIQYNGTWMKINAVYPTAASGTSGASDLGNVDAGMTALGGAVEQVTGLHSDQYVLVGYQALQKTVDAIGGVDIVIQATDPRGIWDKAADLEISNGPHHIDGLTALRISRARNDHEVPGNEGAYGVEDNDFGRTRNQRMILTAILNKVRSTPALANPATMVAMFDMVSSSIRTDMTVSQLRRLYDVATTTNGEPVSITLNGDDTHELLVNYKPGQIDALVPKAGRGEYSALKAWVSTHLF